MASFELESTGAVFYKDGEEVSSRVVGVESKVNRVARYSLTAPAEGANHIDITFYSNGLSAGSKIPVRFFIGTDETSHANAGADAEYTGELTLASDGETFTGAADILLLPGVTYYVWFFPGSTAYGYYSWYGSGVSTLVTSGGAGIVKVVQSSALVPYQVHARKNGAINMYLLYVRVGDQLVLLTG